jgi:NAD(P)-dependent dehydrogenase (short-subunit alcohol dehydrogenase family)
MPKTLMCDPALLQKDLSGHVYIVTGANSGAGLATATQLAKQGATVAGACRHPIRTHTTKHSPRNSITAVWRW